MGRRARPTFHHCYACGELHSSTAIERHHFPVPSRHGGASTIPLCRTCHDLAERINLANWPEGWAERAIEEVLLAAPELLVMWFRTRHAGPPRPELAKVLAGLQDRFRLPVRLGEVARPEEMLMAINDLDRNGRMLALKLLPGLFDDEPDQAAAWSSIRFNFDPHTGVALISYAGLR